MIIFPPNPSLMFMGACMVMFSDNIWSKQNQVSYSDDLNIAFWVWSCLQDTPLLWEVVPAVVTVW